MPKQSGRGVGAERIKAEAIAGRDVLHVSQREIVVPCASFLPGFVARFNAGTPTARRSRVAFLRYNPHGFRVNGMTQRTKKTERERDEELVRAVQNPGDWCPEDLEFSIRYMFYDVVAEEKEDGQTGRVVEEKRPVVLDDADFPAFLKKQVVFL